MAVRRRIGAKLRWGEGQHLRLAAAFYDFINVTGRLNAPGSTLYNYTAPAFMRWGNTVFDIANSGSPSDNLFAYASKFREGDVNATYTWDLGRYTLGRPSMRCETSASMHRRSRPTPATTSTPRTKGYQTQISFGYPTVLTAGAWRALVGYRYLQRDAVIDEYTDSDFHYFGGTNAQGYYVIVDYGVASHVWLRLRYLSANQIDGPEFANDVLQFDVNAGF